MSSARLQKVIICYIDQIMGISKEQMKKISVLATLLVICSGVEAAPLLWVVNNASLSDGGTLTGSFFFDAEIDIYSNINLVTSSGPYLPETTYSDVDVVGLSGDQSINFIDNAGGGPGYLGDFLFVLDLESAMTNDGGVVNLSLNSYELGCLDIDCNQVTNLRSITSGTISAVPIPAAVWLFVSALAGLGWMRRKQPV